MSGFPDQEFDRVATKPGLPSYAPVPPDSGLAIASLILSISGLVVLPVIGPIAGIVTGHMALGQIREAKGTLGGRTMAKIGLILGYVQVVFTILATIAFVLFFAFVASAIINNQPRPVRAADAIKVEVRDSVEPTIAPPHILPSPGVRMGNELGQADLKAIADAKIEVDDADIVAFYVAGEAEFGLLTKTMLLYHKEGRTTTVPLESIETILDDAQYSSAYALYDATTYRIEVATKDGAKVRLNLTPKSEGDPFYRALKDATAKLVEKP